MTDLCEQHLHWTFEYLYSKKLYTGHAKYIFGSTQVEYLGHIVGGGVIGVDPAKTYAIMDQPEPIFVKYVLRYYGYLVSLRGRF